MAPFQTTPHRCQWTGSGVNGDFTTESPLSLSTARLSTAAQTTAAHNTVRINTDFYRGCDTAASDCGRRGFCRSSASREGKLLSSSYAGFSHTVASAVSRRPLGAAELAMAPPVALRTHRATAELQQRKSSTRILPFFPY
ncbi:hypothetical protein MYCTH_2122693 [Thermothelomyces thermophilus ATCC 42464]|uniref:Uncharacterized protein n=1 Tax=Thermothelomyces thermophilus (strain ATCC 42464 / BCRC 31852 / DSM 1799) TaxID=573729 RepID=G2Q5U4_THET4|nr:uncharacterized protein MYCTH_2122693 [Thermothelomyces thermophilus ATCC 42464]AEO53820.1 hypothetical protein MYCTH_2122693 [Thermothelomyces thermophilus ATCC 42464]